jgi:hypothetical protein
MKLAAHVLRHGLDRSKERTESLLGHISKPHNKRLPLTMTSVSDFFGHSISPSWQNQKWYRYVYYMEKQSLKRLKR